MRFWRFNKYGFQIDENRVLNWRGLGVIAVCLVLIIVAICFIVSSFGGSPVDTGAVITQTPTAAPTIEPEPTSLPTMESVFDVGGITAESTDELDALNDNADGSGLDMDSTYSDNEGLDEDISNATPGVAKIQTLGEIAIETPLLEAAHDTTTDTYDFSEMFSMISDVVGDADYTVADVEGTISDNSEYSGDGGGTIITPSTIIGDLKDIGVDMLTVANDHALDGLFAGLMDTLNNCKANNMDYVGGAVSQEEADTPVIVDINGINVAFLNYTDNLNGKEQQSSVKATEYGINYAYTSNCQDDVTAAKNAGAEFIIAYVSWGKIQSKEFTDVQKQIASLLVDAGVDVIIGYGPHLIQPAYWLEKTLEDGTTQRTLCLAATGNFLSNQRKQYTDSGVIFEFTLTKGDTGITISDVTYIPTYVWRQDNGDGTYEYKTLAVGQWLESAPDGMSAEDYTRLKTVWQEAQDIIGDEVATVSAD